MGLIKAVAADGSVTFQGTTGLSIGYESPTLYDPVGSTFHVGDTATITQTARLGRITAVACNGNVKFEGDTGLSIGFEKPTHYEAVVIPSPAPTVTFSATPTSLLSGETSTLTWSSTNATSCSASGAWSGTEPTSGTQTLHPTTTSTYTLACTGNGGSASQSVTVSIITPPPAPTPPTVSFTATPSTLTLGQSASLTWTSTNATSCAASGAWSGAQPTSGSTTQSPLTTSTYTLTCTGAGGSVSQSRIVTVTSPPPVPTVSLSVTPSTIKTGQSANLTWNATNATTCTASGAWSGLYVTRGTLTVSPTVTSTYTLTCSGDGGNVTQSTTLTVNAPTAPTVSLSVAPTSITTAQTATLTWSSTNATTCTASNGWSGTEPTSGTATVFPTITTTYTLTCTGSGGSAAQSVVLTVTPAPPPPPLPTLTMSVSPSTIVSGQSSTLSWTSVNATTCTASGGWSGSQALSGTLTVSPTATTTYTLACTGAGGTTTKSTTLTVATPAPTITFTGSASTVASGTAVTLTWSTTNATSCTASGGWSGAQLTNGSTVVHPTATTTYTLTCMGAGGSAVGSVTVLVTSPPPPGTVLLDVPVTLTRTIPVAYPVVSGCPFARGLIADASRISVVTSAGAELPSQVRVLARWTDGTIKSALIVVIAQQGQTGWIVRVGPTRTVGTTVATPALPGIPSVTDLNGTVSTLGATTQTLAESGPVRTVAQYVGTLSSNLQSRIWVAAYAGLPFVDVEATVVGTATDTTSQLGPPAPFWQYASYDWAFPGSYSGTYTIGGDGTTYSGTIGATNTSLYQKGDSIFGSTFFSNFTVSYSGVGTGARAPGWITTPQKSIAMRYFWQQFPKALRVKSTQLTLSLHPSEYISEPQDPTNAIPRPRTFYSRRSGLAKTYQFLVLTGADASVYTDLVQSPPRAVPTAAYVQSTRVFGNLLPAGTATAGYDDYLLNQTLTKSVDTTNGSCTSMLGWRDFGDRLHACSSMYFFDDTHVGSIQYLEQYLRTRDERWWDFGEIGTRHFMDLDVSHVTRIPASPVASGLASTPPGESLAIKHDCYDHEERNLHRGHMHLSGLPDYYLLTGDFRVEEVLREMGDWWVTVAPSLFPVPAGGAYTDANPHIAEIERDFAWPLWAMNETYRATGDHRYHQTAAVMVAHAIAWWKWQTDHRQDGVIVSRNDYTQGTGFWTMYPAMDNSPKPADYSNTMPLSHVLWNGTGAPFGGAFESALIRAYEDDADWNDMDRATLKTMILQTMNYITKWAWTLPNVGYWTYSEAAPQTNGGENHLLEPMTWCALRIQEGVDHPEWYEQAPVWKQRAQAVYADWANVRFRGFTTTGFYGYETVWPTDWWASVGDLR